MIKIIKRDGRCQNFDLNKTKESIERAADDIYVKLTALDYHNILHECNLLMANIDRLEVEKLQDIIEKALYKTGFRKVRESYKNFRQERNAIRDKKNTVMKTINSIAVNVDRDNANVGNNYSAKLLRIASVSNKYAVLAQMPKPLAKLHENNDLYYHDLDSFNLTTNCLHIPTKKILMNGFNTGYGQINPPKRIESAGELSCILLQSSQNDCFGGQSHPNFDNDLSCFVELTRQELANEIGHDYEYIIKNFSDSKNHDKLNDLIENIESKIIKFEDLPFILKDLVKTKLEASIHQAMQGVIFNLNSMHARAGAQVPFSSINIGIPESEDAALLCKILLEEYEKGLGKGEQAIFPNIIFRVKKGVNRDKEDPYYYLYKLACRVASKRMNPTFMNIDADFNKEYYDKGYMPSEMGCRTYLMSNVNGEPGVEGRGNIAPVTINLVRLGIKAMLYTDDIFPKEKKYTKAYINTATKRFAELFVDMIDKAKDSLLYRYDVLKKLKVKDLPFVAGQGLMRGSEGLNPDDSIEPILKQGTWGIGFIGLAETLTALTGKHHGESEIARDFGEQIIGILRNKTDEFTKETHLNWSCYATPAEGLSGKFIVPDREKYGILKGITDKEYYTNSFHVPVGYKISIKNKIEIEAPYHKLCNGGHISYIELDDYPTPEIVEKILTYAYENTNISYLGINFHIRYCRSCGERLHDEESCPKCGSRDIQGISRVTGYLSLDERFGPGKVAERADRISHDEDHIHVYK